MNTEFKIQNFLTRESQRVETSLYQSSYFRYPATF